MAGTFSIAKVSAAEHLVFGYANVAVSKRGDLIEDLQGDIIPPEELERAAYQFNLHFRGADEMHEGPVMGQLVESMVFTPDKLVKFATGPDGVIDSDVLKVLQETFPPRWWVGFHVPDQSAFGKVLSGEYAMFSIAGEADKEKV